MRRRPWTMSIVSLRCADRLWGPARRAGARGAKEDSRDLWEYVGVYIDINMYYRTRRRARVPGTRLSAPGGLAALALLFAAACAPTLWSAGSPGTDLPPLGIPGVFLTQGPVANPNGLKEGGICEPLLLTATLAGLALVAPAAAQTPSQPTPRKPVPNQPAPRRSGPHEVFVAVLSG